MDNRKLMVEEYGLKTIQTAKGQLFVCGTNKIMIIIELRWKRPFSLLLWLRLCFIF
jgi:hypothetical protein